MIVRMAGTLLFAGLASGAIGASAGPTDQATTPPKAELMDFRLAERRWLSEHYPGRPAPRWQNVLVLPPETSAASTKSDVFVKTETAFVQTPDGSEIAVCFDIGLNTAKAGAHEEAETID